MALKVKFAAVGRLRQVLAKLKQEQEMEQAWKERDEEFIRRQYRKVPEGRD